MARCSSSITSDPSYKSWIESHSDLKTFVESEHDDKQLVYFSTIEYGRGTVEKLRCIFMSNVPEGCLPQLEDYWAYECDRYSGLPWNSPSHDREVKQLIFMPISLSYCFPECYWPSQVEVENNPKRWMYNVAEQDRILLLLKQNNEFAKWVDHEMTQSDNTSEENGLCLQCFTTLEECQAKSKLLGGLMLTGAAELPRLEEQSLPRQPV